LGRRDALTRGGEPRATAAAEPGIRRVVGAAARATHLRDKRNVLGPASPHHAATTDPAPLCYRTWPRA
jgi:hypothetical protein